MTRTDVIAEARRWLETPWKHQGRTFGEQVDCAGLIIEVTRALGIAAVNIRDYSHQPDGVQLQAYCEQHMRPIPRAQMQPADVALMRFNNGPPRHLAFICDYFVAGSLGLIHAYAPARMVIETRLDSVWRDRIVSVYRLPVF